MPAAARADWDPHSTVTAPCGTGFPPIGHQPPDFAPEGPDKHLSLAVKQDGDRLCYVADGIAEAPVIRVHPGDRLTVTLRNEIDNPAAIDNFVPRLPPLEKPNEPVPEAAGFYPVTSGMRHAATGMTNLHLHGFPLPPVAPADETIKTCADPAVGEPRCGRREITYVYDIPKDMPAGAYWYHPHIHGEAQAQVQMGLLGAIIVEGPEDEARRAAGIEERVLLFGQTRAPGKATAAPATMAAAMQMHHDATTGRTPGTEPAQVDTAHEVACGVSDADGIFTLNGTPLDTHDVEAERLAQRDAVGSVQLDAEGELEFTRLLKPTASDDALLTHYIIPEGGKQLWRVINGSTDAYLNIALVDDDDAPTAVEIVGRDGVPLTDDAGRHLPPLGATDRQLIPPAGRLEFLVAAPAPGRKRYLVTDAVNTGCVGDKQGARRLALVTAGPAAPETAQATLASAPMTAAVSEDYLTGLLARRTDRIRTIALTEYPRPGSEDENDFYITELKPGAEMRPYAMNGTPDISVQAGTVEEWVIENWTHELHAFHIHQIHFRVLEENGRPYRDPPLLDVVNVPFANPDTAMPPGFPLTPGRIRIKLYFPPELAGDIPFHCHLMQHEDNGMMAMIHVAPATKELHGRADIDGPDYAALANPPICHSTPQTGATAPGSLDTLLGKFGIPWKAAPLAYLATAFSAGK